jgi:hypothetical protein
MFLTAGILSLTFSSASRIACTRALPIGLIVAFISCRNSLLRRRVRRL